MIKAEPRVDLTDCKFVIISPSKQRRTQLNRISVHCRGQLELLEVEVRRLCTVQKRRIERIRVKNKFGVATLPDHSHAHFKMCHTRPSAREISVRNASLPVDLNVIGGNVVRAIWYVGHRMISG